MRTGLIVSVIGHAAVLLWGLVSLPSPSTLDISNLEAVPIDFIPIDELTQLNLGVTTAEAREEEVVPDPPAPVVAEIPPEPPLFLEPEPLPPVPEPEPEPLPQPEPVLSEPEPLPEPPEPAPEPLPEPEPVVAPEPEPPPEEEVAAPEPPKPAPVPRPRPKPPQTQVAKAETDSTFDTDQISALLDKSEPTGASEASETPPTLGSATGSITERMTQNELDALRSRLASCWNIQLAPPDLAELRVRVKMFLNPDGSLLQAPQVLEVGSSEFARTAAESAIRAVRRCAPYDLPAEKYDSWREINVTFDPREMFGG